MAVETMPDVDEDAVATAKPAFLRRVRIRGYKSIAFCDVALEPLTILVGRNASGKSNFLDALAFLRDALETNIPEAVRRHGGWSSVLHKDAEDRQVAIEVEVGFRCGRPFERVDGEFALLYTLPIRSQPSLEGIPLVAVYGFVIEAKQNDIPVRVREYLQFPEQDNVTDLEFDVERDISRRPDRLFLGSVGNQPFIEIGDGLRFMSFHNFHPDAIRGLQKPAPGGMLDRDGSNLAGLLKSVGEIDEETVDRVRRYLRAVVPDVEGFRVVRYGDYETVRFSIGRGPDRVVEFDASSMSDGTLRALAALAAAFQIFLPTGPTIVGIEEPETALHPAAMRALVAAMDEATLRTQILLTTHSPDLLDAAPVKPENVRVVQMIDGRTVIGPVDEASVGIVRDHLSTLGGLERERQLEPDFDDLRRQEELFRQERGTK